MRPLISIVVLMLTLAAGRALAEDEKLPAPQDAGARAHLEAGNKAYRLKDFEAAVREYRAGAQAETGPTYTFWYNLGQAYRQLGRNEDAIWFYSQFLAQAPPSLRLHRDAASSFIEQMNADLERPPAAPPPTEPAATAPTEPAAATSGQAQAERPVRAEVRERWYRDRIGWALAGVGAVSLGISGGLILSGRSLDNQANAEDAQADRKSLRDRASTRMLAGGIAGSIGAVVLTVGIVKLVKLPGGGRESAVSIVPTIGGASWVVEGRF